MHYRELGYLAAARAVRREGSSGQTAHWQLDRTNIVLRLAREVCSQASSDCGDPSVDSDRSVAAVLALAKADPEGFLSLADLRRTLPQAHTVERQTVIPSGQNGERRPKPEPWRVA
jgi:hypothetical protein